MKKHFDGLLLVGWREWCSLPYLEIPAIKVKIDTGARTSALHAFDICLINKKHSQKVSFLVHPIQGNKNCVIRCEAPVIDQRCITSSNGHRENRYIITTAIKLGNEIHETQLSLSNRDPLKFRMLLGREALKNWALIDPRRSFCQGRIRRKDLQVIYKKV